MAHRAVQARCWRAVRDGDVEYLRLSAPEDWVVANADSAVELARAQGHLGLAEYVRGSKARSLMADTSAAQFDEQLRESVLQARQSAKASASEMVGAGLQGSLVGDTDGGRTTIDPLPWIHCGACFAPSQRVT